MIPINSNSLYYYKITIFQVNVYNDYIHPLFFRTYMHDEKLEKLHSMKASAEMGGGAERVEAQHEKGKLTARERIDLLLDVNSFIEIDKYVVHRSSETETKKYYGDGVIIGFGKINGREVC